MARNQVVMPGNAAFHIAIQADDFEDDDDASADLARQREHGGYVDGMSE